MTCIYPNSEILPCFMSAIVAALWVGTCPHQVPICLWIVGTLHHQYPKNEASWLFQIFVPILSFVAIPIIVYAASCTNKCSGLYWCFHNNMLRGWTLLILLVFLRYKSWLPNRVFNFMTILILGTTFSSSRYQGVMLPSAQYLPYYRLHI